jgi:F-type H+-transporting ATPase subunit a
MRISPDSVEVWRIGDFPVSMTLAGAWIVMALLTLASWLVTRRFRPDFKMTGMQNAAETLVAFLRDQTEDVLERPAGAYLPLIGYLCVFILAANWSALLPVPFKTEAGWEWLAPTTASFSTTLALAFVVMASVVYFGVRRRGIRGYLAKYLKPVAIMLPLNVLSELANGFSLAVRLYGNIMSGAVLGAIVFMLAPFAFPALMNIYGLLAGTIQPYIFVVLSLVYIGSGLGSPGKAERRKLEQLKQRRI